MRILIFILAFIVINNGRNATDNIGGSGVWANQITYDYDPLNRLIHVTEQDGYTINYTWRGDGQKGMVSVSAPGDPNNVLYGVDYVYDTAGRLAHVFEPELGLGGFVASLGYDDNGNREALSYYLNGDIFGSTMDMAYSYNRDNFLTGFSTTGGPTFSFDADGSGDIDGLGRLVSASETLTKTDSNTITHTLSYTYDRLSRLDYAKTNNVPPMSYIEFTPGYDDAGNVLAMMFDDGTGDVTTNYSFTGDLVTGDGTNSVAWDDNGRQTSQLAATPANFYLEYDDDGRLRQAQAGSAGDYMTAKYTPDGARIAKERVWSDVSDYHHKYIVDASGEFPVILLVLDADNSNAILKTYIHANGQVIMQHDGDMEGDRNFYLHDRLGSVRQVVDSSGDVVNCYTFDPWGLPVGSETAETIDNLYRFANYAWDDEPQMYHCFRREYDPVLFRFTSRDPMQGDYQEPMTLHAYLYCLNNPINATDPTGMVTKEEVTYATGTATGLGAAAGPQAMSILQNVRTFAEIMSQRMWVYGQTVANAAQGRVNEWTRAMNQIGMQVHHIVGRGWGNVQEFGKGVLNSAQNLIALEPQYHAQITQFMNSGWRIHEFMRNNPQIYGEASTLQQYVTTLSYADQWRWGASLLIHLATYGNLAGFTPGAYGL